MTAQIDEQGEPQRQGKRGNPNWIKGQSANPGGRPKIQPDVRLLCQNLTIPAVKALSDGLTHPKASLALRARCAEIILERAWGKPAITVDPDASAALASGAVSLMAALQRISMQPGDAARLVDATPASHSDDDDAQEPVPQG